MDSFYLRDYDVDVFVKYKIKNSVIKLHINIIDESLPKIHHRRDVVVSGTFSLKDYSLIYMSHNNPEKDYFIDSNELSQLDLLFNKRLLNTLINCLEINKERLTFKYFKGFLRELKEIKKEIGDEK
ncbi:MAG: hypothetical protein ACRC0G_14285 [Fusobacteriaceae bacterium]